MKDNFLFLISLFDIYGNLLSENERESFEQYYCDDLSLSEISENLGITRQGVRDNIVRAEKSLLEYDKKLNLKTIFDDINNKIKDAKKYIDEEKYESAKELLSKIEI